MRNAKNNDIDTLQELLLTTIATTRGKEKLQIITLKLSKSS